MSNDPRGHGEGGGETDGSPPLTMHRPDIFVSAIVLVICGILFAATFRFEEVPSSLAQNVQPADFPRLVLLCIALVALILPFEHHRKLPQGIDLDAERRDPPAPIVYATAAALVVFVAALPWLGPLPALALITVGLPVLWGERRWKILIPYVLLFPIAILFLFAEVLQVTFPRGLTGGIFY